MPDITMCTNTYCELRPTCYRIHADPSSVWQSWALFEPEVDHDSGKTTCEHYIKTRIEK